VQYTSLAYNLASAYLSRCILNKLSSIRGHSLGMHTPPNRLRRVVVSATSAIALLLLGLVTISGNPSSGLGIELVQLHAADQQPAVHLYVTYWSIFIPCPHACLCLRKSSSQPQSGAVSLSNEKKYLSTVFRSRLDVAALPKHGDFSAAIAKETKQGILKVRPRLGAAG
jgi:hypothetical protein